MSQPSELNVLHLASGLENESAGTTYAVLKYAGNQERQEGCSASILAAGKLPAGFRDCPARGFPLHGGKANVFLYSGPLRRALKSAASGGQCDLIHVHGLWKMSNILAARYALRYHRKLVLSPHGMLEAYALTRSAWKKKLFSLVGHSWALRRTDLFLATAPSEYEAVRRQGLRQPVMIVPLGFEVRKDAPPKKYDESARTVAYLGRLNEKKGLDFLLKAWARLQDDFPAWNLEIAGACNHDYAVFLKQLAERLHCRRVTFLGEINGTAKLDFLRRAQLNVLPTRSENFGMTVLEAASEATPVMVSKGAPWEAVARNRAGWWIEIGEEALYSGMAQAMSLPAAELTATGQRALRMVEEEYSWQKITEQIIAGYRWLLDGGPMPGNIIVE